MIEKEIIILKNFSRIEPGALKQQFVNVEEALGTDLPKDYVAVMQEFNGGEGEIGDNSWLELFPVEQLLKINQEYHLLMEQIPEYFLFGKDAADTGYALHKQNKTYHAFGLMSNFKFDIIEFCGNSFLEFLEFLDNA
ncbi:SMI1/KNR4 family protein [Pedobacter jeongneungensis]|uniref:SMI1/KNR4 family protein n=1 Tax=Pedobacter jeongneungensis TaxID=947309 RepID=UPI000469A626|nr:SMI1/KNR4 family protein [Pedobacter jeongneungensis]